MRRERRAGALDRLLTPKAWGQTAACYIQPADRERERKREREMREEANPCHRQPRLINALPVDMFSAVSSEHIAYF